MIDDKSRSPPTATPDQARAPFCAPTCCSLASYLCSSLRALFTLLACAPASCSSLTLRCARRYRDPSTGLPISKVKGLKNPYPTPSLR